MPGAGLSGLYSALQGADSTVAAANKKGGGSTPNIQGQEAPNTASANPMTGAGAPQQMPAVGGASDPMAGATMYQALAQNGNPNTQPQSGAQSFQQGMQQGGNGNWSNLLNPFATTPGASPGATPTPVNNTGSVGSNS